MSGTNVAYTLNQVQHWWYEHHHSGRLSRRRLNGRKATELETAWLSGGWTKGCDLLSHADWVTQGNCDIRLAKRMSAFRILLEDVTAQWAEGRKKCD